MNLYTPTALYQSMVDCDWEMREREEEERQEIEDQEESEAL